MCRDLVLKEEVKKMRWKDTNNKPRGTSTSWVFFHMGLPYKDMHTKLIRNVALKVWNIGILHDHARPNNNDGFFCGQSRNFIKDEALQDSHFLAREEQH
jgi:hypothetical protein